MHLPWSSLRHQTRPSKEFKENLRAQLYESSSEDDHAAFQILIQAIELPIPKLRLSVEKKYPLFHTIKKRILVFHDNFKKTLFILAGGALATVLIVPMFSFFSASSSVAYQQSMIRSIEGTIAIKRGESVLLAENNKEVSIGDTIVTDSFAKGEIIFFEGSVIRLDEDTQIKIEQMSPNPVLFASGGIKIELQKGHIWVKTFQDSNFQIRTPNSLILPNRASIDVEYKDGKEYMTVFENSSQIDIQGVTLDGVVSLQENESIIFTPFDEDLPQSRRLISTSSWIEENKTKDFLLKKEFLNTVSKKIKEEYFKEEFSEKIHDFFNQNPNPKEVEDLIVQMNQFLILTDSTIPEVLDSNDINQEIIEVPEVEIEEKNNQKKTVYKTRVLQTKTADSEITNLVDQSTQSPEPTILPTPVRIVPTKEKTAKEIFEENRVKRYNKAAINFSDQINAYTFEASRKTQSENILKKIPDTEESIELLEIMEDQAPRDVKKFIKRKKVLIIRSLQEEELKESAPVEKSLIQKTREETLQINTEETLNQEVESDVFFPEIESEIPGESDKNNEI